MLGTLSRDFRVSVLWELFFAEGLVIIATSVEEYIEHVKAWKQGLESKGIYINMKMTILMASVLKLEVLCDSGKYPCACAMK